MFLKQNSLVFNPLKKGVDEEYINEMIPFNFNGKSAFIDFYQSHNGVSFPEGAEVRLQEGLVKQDYGLEIEFFYDIERILKYRDSTKRHSTEAQQVSETHFPFGSDSSGNDYWIQIDTGLVKFIDWETFGGEKSELLLVASNFKDFCAKIIPIHSHTIRK